MLVNIPNREDPIASAQRLIVGGILQTTELGKWIEKIADARLWAGRRASAGQPFKSFAEFATAPSPYGLGVCSQDAMDELGIVLHGCGLYGIWSDLLQATTRKRGHRNLAGSENRIPFFKLPTSATSRARQVVLLARHHPSIFSRLESRELTLAESVKAANLQVLRRRRNLRFNVFDIEQASKLGNAAKKKLLREVFTILGREAQCHLLCQHRGADHRLSQTGKPMA